MQSQLRKKLIKLASHEEPYVLRQNEQITVELNGEPFKVGTVREIADQFDVDLSLFNTLTKDAFESTLQGLSVAGKIKIKLGHKV